MNNPIKLAILHGSRATGKAHKNSDWDVAVLAEKKLDLDEKLRLMRVFGEKFDVPSEKVDIADLRSDSPLLLHEVADKGKLLVGNEEDFFKFKILAWKKYTHAHKFFKAREQRLYRQLSIET